jgi:phage FluMu gp28-like protein
MTDLAIPLLPYQARWVADQCPLKVWRKSRRIGASYGAAAGFVLHAAAQDGGNAYYISYDKEMTSGFIADCATWASAMHQAITAHGEEVLTRDDGRDVHTFNLKFASGHEIKTFSSNPRNLRSKGRPRDRLLVDEAAFVDDLDELLKAGLALTMWGGRIEIISTDNGVDNPYAILIEDIRAGRYGALGEQASVHFTPIDLALQEGLFRRICQVTGQVWSPAAEAAWLAALEHRYRSNRDEELYGIPRASGGSYLSRALIEAGMPAADHSGPLLRFAGTADFNLRPEPLRAREIADWLEDQVLPVLAGLDPARRHVAGMDFARSGDTTALVLLELGATLQRTWRAVVELHNCPFAQQRQVLFACLAGLPRFAGAALDAGGNGAQLAEETAERFGRARIAQVKFTEQIYREAFPRYKAGLEDRTTTLIRHDDVLEDHRAVQLVRGVPRVPEGKTDARGQRHGDSAIAGLLADMAANTPAGPIEWTAVPRRGRVGLAGLDAEDDATDRGLP